MKLIDFFNGLLTCSLTLKDFYSRPPVCCKFIMTYLVPRRTASLEVQKWRLEAKLRSELCLRQINNTSETIMQKSLSGWKYLTMHYKSILKNIDRILH